MRVSLCRTCIVCVFMFSNIGLFCGNIELFRKNISISKLALNARVSLLVVDKYRSCILVPKHWAVLRGIQGFPANMSIDQGLLRTHVFLYCLRTYSARACIFQNIGLFCVKVGPTFPQIISAK